MAGSWTAIEITQGFTGRVDQEYAELSLKLRRAAAAFDMTLIAHLSDECDKCTDFSSGCKTISDKICRMVPPLSAGVAKIRSASGSSRNFYEFRSTNWTAYFHIDYKLLVLTRVLARHIKDLPLISLHNTLLEIIENFRSRP